MSVGVKMIYIAYFKSIIGTIKIKCLDQFLIESSFIDDNEQYENELLNNPTISKVISWLESYFKGLDIDIDFPILMQGSAFQKDVWLITSKIPYGKVITYKDIKQKLCSSGKYHNVSCQAIGQALKKNPLLIFIPCHRVVSSNNKNIGYSAGIDKKVFLLDLESSRI